MDDEGVVEACRGRKACRGSMSWTTGMSWKHVVEDTLFRGGCRGDCVSMSWVTGMSWKHVVDARDVVEVCRRRLVCRGSMSWKTPFFEGDVVGTVLVCRG